MAEIEDIRSIRAHLTQEQLKNVYLFYGPEMYLKDLYTRRIRDRLALDQMNCFFTAQTQIRKKSQRWGLPSPCSVSRSSL